MYNAIQIYETADTKTDADAMLNALALQSGFIGGRVMDPHPARLQHPTAYVVQAFVENDADPNAPLPDGMRRVLILNSQRAMLGIGYTAKE